MKKWKSILRHPLKKIKSKKDSLHTIRQSRGSFMQQTEVKEGVNRFSKVVLPRKEVRLLKEIKIL